MIQSGAISGTGSVALCCASVALADTAEPLMTEPVLSTTNLVGTAGGLALVLVLILGLAWLVRRFGRFPGMANGPVQVLGGVSLGPREKAVLLSVHGRHLLVGVAPGNIRTLHVIDEPTPAAPLDEAVDAGFAQALNRVNPTGRES